MTPSTLVAALRQNAEAHADKPYIRVFDGQLGDAITFGELWRRAAGIGTCLRQEFGAGGVCLIFLTHSIELFPVFFGAMAAGLVPSFMPCPSAKQHKDVYWQSHLALLRRIRPAVIVTDRRHAQQMAENGFGALAIPIRTVDLLGDTGPLGALPDPNPDSVAFLQHSSGTTGLKKGVALSHRAALAQIESYQAALGATPSESIASWLPVYHDMGLIACTLMPAVLGQTVTLIDPFIWTMRPGLLFDAIEASGAAYAWLPNFAFEHLARVAGQEGRVWSLASMRAFINCSEPCKLATFDRFLEAFASSGVRSEQLQICYAMAETVFAATQTPMGAAPLVARFDPSALRERNRAVPSEGGVALLSAGVPVPGLAVTIRRDGIVLGDDQVGEICVTGTSLFDGYYAQPEITAERLVEGVYHSRDLGFVHDGALYVLGRLDDQIIVHGKNLLAHEVEAALNDITGLKPGRNVAFGVANEATGSQDLVVVAERDGTGEPGQDTRIRREIRERIFDVAAIAPADCVVVDTHWLVKTTSGKISRTANAEKYLRLKQERREPRDA